MLFKSSEARTMGEEFTVFKRVWWLSHIIFQQCTAIVVFNILWTVYEVYDLSTLSAWHVVFCTLGVSLHSDYIEEKIRN